MRLTTFGLAGMAQGFFQAVPPLKFTFRKDETDRGRIITSIQICILDIS